MTYSLFPFPMNLSVP